jgi:hypothetical protein
VDWEGTAFRACIDDLAKLLGEFQEPSLHLQARPDHDHSGEFVVANCEIKKMRVRAEAGELTSQTALRVNSPRGPVP